MQRRRFLQSLAAAIVAGGLQHIPAFANQANWKQQFHNALQRHPWLLGFATVPKPVYDLRPLQITGHIPKNLRGSLYRNGPARHEIGDMRYHHWFDGDGMVHRYHIDGQKIYHQGRFVETDKYLSEQDGMMHEYGFGTALPEMKAPTSADAINTANINIIEHNGELLALWEGGSAYRIDAKSLETLGLKHWNEDTQGAPFGAHPRRDLDGTLWNFGYAAGFNALLLYQINAAGIMQRTSIVPMQSVPMVHDFLITENYLVFILPPFHYQAAPNKSFLDQFHWHEDQGGEVLIIEKATLQSVARYSIPSFWVFHFSNAFESAKNEIRLQAPIYASPDIMTNTLRNIMRGDIEQFPAQFSSITLNWAKETFDIEQEPDLMFTEFPIIDRRVQGRRFENTFMLQNQNDRTVMFDTLVHVNGSHIQKYNYGNGYIIEEHVFTPDPSSNKEGQGWLIGTALDYQNKQTVLSIFDAQNISSGPIAQAKMAGALPLGLHGSFVASA